LEPKEKKLLLLAFDPSASTGETVNAINALALRWKQKYQDGHQLIADLEKGSTKENSPPSRSAPSPFASVVLQFGKHRGKRLDEVDPAYLLWVLENFTGLWAETRKAIERYLRG
jgi:hypothetical protein